MQDCRSFIASLHQHQRFTFAEINLTSHRYSSWPHLSPLRSVAIRGDFFLIVPGLTYARRPIWDHLSTPSLSMAVNLRRAVCSVLYQVSTPDTTFGLDCVLNYSRFRLASLTGLFPLSMDWQTSLFLLTFLEIKRHGWAPCTSACLLALDYKMQEASLGCSAFMDSLVFHLLVISPHTTPLWLRPH